MRRLIILEGPQCAGIADSVLSSSAMTSPPATTIACAGHEAGRPARQAREPRRRLPPAATSRPRGLALASSARASRLRAARLRHDIPDRALPASGVSVKPGQTALTVMPVPANSSASARVRPMTPCFAADIGRDIGVALKPRGRGDVDDPRLWPARLQIRQDGLRHEIDAGEVGRDHPRPEAPCPFSRMARSAHRPRC